MTRTRLGVVLATGLLACVIPLRAHAFPFGGAIGQIIFCYNNAIYANVGPPRGGPFIWTPSTRTYKFGPPMRSGQWLLGLAAPPYYCIVSKQPIVVWSGILMTMEGSSGAPAPAYTPSPTPSPAPIATTTPPVPYDWGPYCRDRDPSTGVPSWWKGTPPIIDPCK